MRSSHLRAVLAGLLLFGIPSLASAFTAAYFFGDSLSDTGKACSALALDFPAQYAPGRCTNGANWTEYFAAGLGVSATSQALGGTNYANGGDLAADIDGQIDQYSPGNSVAADPAALYSLWIGGNDILGQQGNASTPVPATAVADAIADVSAAIQRLAALGATNFIVPNLPDIGRAYGGFEIPPSQSNVPFTPEERDFMTTISLQFNDELASEIASLRTALGIQVFELDIESILEEAFADPTGFGLVADAIDNVSDDTAFGVPCLVDSNCSADPQGPTAEGFLLFDPIHPTTTAHAIVAGRALTLVPEPGSGVLLGLGVAALARRRAGARRSV